MLAATGTVAAPVVVETVVVDVDDDDAHEAR
jgi:hypothetical protein